MALPDRRPLTELVRAAVRRNLAAGDDPQQTGAASGGQTIAASRAAVPTRNPDPLPRPGVAPGAALAQGGLHESSAAAVTAASRAFPTYRTVSLQMRQDIIANIRRRLLEHVEDLSRQAVEETGLGRVADKIAKNRLVITKTPGPEILVPEAVSGDDGLTLTEYAPFGVIAAITPVTNPSETVINNAIGMLAGGNVVVLNAHPGAKGVTASAIGTINAAAREAGSPVDLLHACREPSIETAQQLMRHPEVALLVVTGGAGVVKAAMDSGKKVIAAGAGNPPVVVDATADLSAAAACITAGASYDNNIVCVAEKVLVAEASIQAQLLAQMQQHGCRLLTPEEFSRVQKVIFSEDRGPGRPAVLNRRWIGQDARKILREAGVLAAGDPRLAVAQVPADHPLAWTEQMLPVLPVVSAADAREAIELAVRFEQNRRHTAMMHSQNVSMLSLMAQRINTSIFIKNGSCAAGLGAGGEGFTSFTIASPTGEGLTTARDFCRRRRCVLVGSFRIV